MQTSNHCLHGAYNLVEDTDCSKDKDKEIYGAIEYPGRLGRVSEVFSREVLGWGGWEESSM